MCREPAGDALVRNARSAGRQRGAAGGWLLATIAVAALLWWFASWDAGTGRRAGPPVESRPVAARGSLAEDEQNNVNVFKSASPSAVNITTLELARDLQSLNVLQVPSGTGTGIVWDDRGHIVTNFHVIQDATGARVTLSDHSVWMARLVGVFPDRDLAVLRIEAPQEKLKPVTIGTSRDLVVGQKVYAIGNPFGLDQSLTTGIISALNREIDSVTKRPIRGVIQTDAAINPGNSGGPLLDSAGRLIGVNTAIYSPSGASAGIGFAIPVDEVNRVVPSLIRHGKFVRPSLGVRVAPLEFQNQLGVQKGVAIIGVLPRGPAAAAGLKPFQRAPGGELIVGDVIVAVAGKAVSTLEEILDVLEKHQPGDTVTLSLVRAKDEAVDVRVRLGASE
ncbi:MAG: trypsin-like peptidase domain-containing protein [Burkholderiales bacterium]|nr:trypsin-like peptidase domain-containing protein [Burkholderiales bacterium]